MRLLLPCFLLLTACTVHAADSRLYLLSQYNWGDKAGFYIDFEGNELATLPLILGTADGANWSFARHAPGFVVGREYAIRAVIGPETSFLELDGQRVGELKMAWKPAAGPVIVDDSPEWARGPADWFGITTAASVTLTRGGKQLPTQTFDFAGSTGLAEALHFFEPSFPQRQPLDTQPGDTLTTELKLKFINRDLHAHAPFIDPYGQARAANYPGKIKTDEDFKADLAAEDAELAKLPPSQDFDQYGGYKQSPWHETPTGFFRTVKRDGKWWLITPEGNPTFYTGVCAAPQLTWETTPVTGREYLYEWLPPHEGQFAPAWAKDCWGGTDGTEYCCFYTANLIRKYGDNWAERATDRALRRLQSLGLQGGKWGCGVQRSSTPVLHRWDLPNLVKHPDIFDEKIQQRVRESLVKQLTPLLQDPWVVGWSWGNEYDELITRQETKDIIKLPPNTPARRALFNYALEELYQGDLQKLAQTWQIKAHDPEALQLMQPTVPDEDIEMMRLFYQARYHEFIYKAVKEIDPNHLYLGFWIVPGWWESPEDWPNTTPYCDVIGYDRYAPEFADERLLALLQKSDKPALCGEFSFPQWYDGKRGFGRYGTWSKDEADAGELYKSWTKSATANPYCLGLIWFLYRDQPLTGRGPGRGDQLAIGEHYAFGIVTETDRVKWPLARAIRGTNDEAAKWRLGEK